MNRTFKKVDYEQALDLTVRLGDCLPPEHLARFVVDSVALLDLSALYAKYGVRVGEPYAPEIRKPNPPSLPSPRRLALLRQQRWMLAILAPQHWLPVPSAGLSHI